MRLDGTGTSAVAGSPAEQRREAIRALVPGYVSAAFAPEPFVPGQTRVPASGKVFGAEEVSLLVDSALDFWLTSGRYAEQFGLGGVAVADHAALEPVRGAGELGAGGSDQTAGAALGAGHAPAAGAQRLRQFFSRFGAVPARSFGEQLTIS